MRGKRGSSGRRTSKRRLGKWPWSRLPASTNTATTPAGCKALPALGQRRLGLSVRIPEQVHQARRGLARGGPPCQENWSPQPCSGPFSRSHSPRACSSTRTGVVPGRAANIAATPTAPSCTGTGPCVRRAAAASTTITPRPKASGLASKPRCSNYASGPFLPTWPTHRSASPTILTTIITTGCTLERFQVFLVRIKTS